MSELAAVSAARSDPRRTLVVAGVAHALHDVLSYALDGRIEDCREALKERFGTLTERQEVLT